ncbi:MAG: hypothetical protein GEV10_24810 [Streptosporangiales bacterium]|nr:hypothetical protein [Streptosporangiales bacterium]
MQFDVRGHQYTGTLVVPDGHSGSAPVVVLSRDWPVATPTAVAAATTCLPAAGFATFGYRSSSPRCEQTRLRPNELVIALRAAVARLRSEPDIDSNRVGVLGVGPIAGGVALVAAADDPWVKAVYVHDPVLDGESWMKERAEFDDEEWDSQVAETMARLRARTVGAADADHVLIGRSGAADAIDLVAFDHLLRFRPAQHAARIPSSQLRVMRTGDATGECVEDIVAQGASWFGDALRTADYDVSYEAV